MLMGNGEHIYLFNALDLSSLISIKLTLAIQPEIFIGSAPSISLRADKQQSSKSTSTHNTHIVIER